jgi:hypothetical protein
LGLARKGRLCPFYSIVPQFNRKVGVDDMDDFDGQGKFAGDPYATAQGLRGPNA